MSTRIKNTDFLSAKTLMGGSVVDSTAGLGAVVLSILGLVGVIPQIMGSLAVLALGAGFFAQGMSAQLRRQRIIQETSETHMGPGGFGSGIAAGSIAGLASLTLGVLSLIGFKPTVLIPIAVISFGGAMILGSTMLYRLNEYLIANSETPDEEKAASDREARGASDLHLFVGIGAVVLGILTLLNPTAMTFAFIALIGVGAANLVSGGELVDRSAYTLVHA